MQVAKPEYEDVTENWIVFGPGLRFSCFCVDQALSIPLNLLHTSWSDDNRSVFAYCFSDAMGGFSSEGVISALELAGGSFSFSTSGSPDVDFRRSPSAGG